MIELIQVRWSPFCLVQKRILEYGGIPHKKVDIPPSDRSLVWRLSKKRYYQVPALKDGRTFLFEVDDNSQVIAKYLDSKFRLGLFPPQWDGIERIVWRYIEDDIEPLTFKLNDAWYREFVPPAEQLQYVRFKERKFGHGCLDQWRLNEKQLIAELTGRLVPFEQMLGTKPFLLDGQPRFVDFDLLGMLANFLYSGHYKLPAILPKLRQWYGHMSRIQSKQVART